MFKILRIETNTAYDDGFATYEEALEMARMFILDDTEYNEPTYSYAVLNEHNQLFAVLRKNNLYEYPNT